MFRQLPPAGEPIVLQRSTTPLHTLLGAEHFVLYDSGTSALAAAVRTVRRTVERTGYQVLMPGYACPALVSAVLWAGGEPVFVDLERDTPWMDLDDLRAKISNRSLAVIAVDLFGIPERYAALRGVTREAGITLIQDAAQRSPPAAPDEGDLTVYSFGRGKPVSLLGGGALVSHRPHLASAMPQPDQVARDPLRGVKVALYNLLSHPRLYWMPAGIPWLGLGRTRFTELDGIAALPPRLAACLAANLQFPSGPTTVQRKLAALVSLLAGERIVDLPAHCGAAEMPLGRYPILVHGRALRKRLHDAWQRAGLGVSGLYPAPLPQIAGVAEAIRWSGRLPESERFAASLLTLPVHSRVGDRDLRRMERVASRVLERLQRDARELNPEEKPV